MNDRELLELAAKARFLNGEHMNRKDRRRLAVAHEYALFAQIQTGGAYQQCHARRNMQDSRGPLPDFSLPSGPLDAPDYMPAGSMCGHGQREYMRP